MDPAANELRPTSIRPPLRVQCACVERDAGSDDDLRPQAALTTTLYSKILTRTPIAVCASAQTNGKRLARRV